jgi:hypothetical protein
VSPIALCGYRLCSLTLARPNPTLAMNIWHISLCPYCPGGPHKGPLVDNSRLAYDGENYFLSPFCLQLNVPVHSECLTVFHIWIEVNNVQKFSYQGYLSLKYTNSEPSFVLFQVFSCECKVVVYSLSYGAGVAELLGSGGVTAYCFFRSEVGLSS